MSNTTIQAEHIVLGSESGPQLKLSAYGGLELCVHGRTIASLTVKYDRPCLSFLDPNGQERMALFIENGGMPEIRLNDGNERTRLSCRVDPDGSPSFELLDPLGQPRLACTLWTDDCTPRVYLHDKDGKEHSVIKADDAGVLSIREKSPDGCWRPWEPETNGKQGERQ